MTEYDSRSLPERITALEVLIQQRVLTALTEIKQQLVLLGAWREQMNLRHAVDNGRAEGQRDAWQRLRSAVLDVRTLLLVVAAATAVAQALGVV